MPEECDGSSLSCAADQVCLGQVTTPVIGACYEGCTLFASGMGCSGNLLCEPVEFGGTTGACFQLGSGALNGTCTQDDVSSGCAANAGICIDDGGANTQCRAICNFFGSPAGCGAPRHCGVNDVCTGVTPDPAALNGHCNAAATAGDGCGANANAVRGVCIDAGDPTLSCLKWCRLAGNDCTGGLTCLDVFMDGTPVGVCD